MVAHVCVWLEVANGSLLEKPRVAANRCLEAFRRLFCIKSQIQGRSSCHSELKRKHVSFELKKCSPFASVKSNVAVFPPVVDS